jgi:hypothetical protein
MRLEDLMAEELDQFLQYDAKPVTRSVAEDLVPRKLQFRKTDAQCGRSARRASFAAEVIKLCRNYTPR